MSPRYERRQRGGGGALLLLIAAAALVVAVLAIFTDVFSGKKAPDKDTDSPAVTQPADGEPDGTGDAAAGGQCHFRRRLARGRPPRINDRCHRNGFLFTLPPVNVVEHFFHGNTFGMVNGEWLIANGQ